MAKVIFSSFRVRYSGRSPKSNQTNSAEDSGRYNMENKKLRRTLVVAKLTCPTELPPARQNEIG